jgi:2-dehydro-3-deoxygalactonokinase
LIGEELRAETPGLEVVLIGAPALTMRYALALKTVGSRTRVFGAEAAWAGLTALHAAMGVGK